MVLGGDIGQKYHRQAADLEHQHTAKPTRMNNQKHRADTYKQGQDAEKDIVAGIKNIRTEHLYHHILTNAYYTTLKSEKNKYYLKKMVKKFFYGCKIPPYDFFGENKMTFIAPNHFSYKFKLDTDHAPVSQTDKFSSHLIFWGLVGGLLFVALGSYELLAYLFDFSDESYDFKLPPEMTLKQLIILRYSFDVLILLLGLIIVTVAICAMRRSKIVYFDGDKVRVTHKTILGKVIVEEEDLYNYTGVLMTVEYYQIGLITRNRYIIELYHPDRNKCVPLYISTSGKDINEIWYHYADTLKMPALFLSDHGLVSKHYDELNKTLQEMAKHWHSEALYRKEENVPKSLKYRTRKGRTVFKESRAFFDIYGILMFLLALALGGVFVWSIMNYALLKSLVGVFGFAAIISICGCLFCGFLIGLFAKDVLIITDKDVMLGHNFAMLRADIEVLPKEEIESVDIGHNPISGRYYLSIIAHHGSIIFGKNMPIEDLRWIRGCLIREIVK